LTIATQVDPNAVASAAPNGIADAGTPPDAQAPASTPAASDTTDTTASGAIDWKARHDKLLAESMPRLQSERDTLKAKVADLETRLAEIGDVDQVEYEVAHERDTALLAWLTQLQAGGFTLRQAVEKFTRQVSEANGEREQFETKKQSVESVIAVVAEYDKPFSAFLQKMDKLGSVVSMQTIPALRETYNELVAAGKTPTQAAAAASTDASEAPGKEAPVVASGGSASRVPAAPVYKPGMRSRDLFGLHLAGHK
jgi:hypothetical protein